MDVSSLLRLYRYLRLPTLSLHVLELTSFTGKIYVQDLIDEDGRILGDLILHKSAYVYICGDAKNMAKEVEDRLCDILGNARNGTGEVEGRRELKLLSDRRVRQTGPFRQTLTMYRDIN
jgi:sulfite reductase alpha subunit-like flavoprotein